MRWAPMLWPPWALGSTVGTLTKHVTSSCNLWVASRWPSPYCVSGRRAYHFLRFCAQPKPQSQKRELLGRSPDSTVMLSMWYLLFVFCALLWRDILRKPWQEVLI